ncbi:hypothetical protein BU17DRAFT_64683 [Hysterangium stoloniferum]|nr:hypothetical protein BU17DRAFT_64683 [Hysterangium stoloniferum]
MPAPAVGRSQIGLMGTEVVISDMIVIHAVYIAIRPFFIIEVEERGRKGSRLFLRARVVNWWRSGYHLGTHPQRFRWRDERQALSVPTSNPEPINSPTQRDADQESNLHERIMTDDNHKDFYLIVLHRDVSAGNILICLQGSDTANLRLERNLPPSIFLPYIIVFIHLVFSRPHFSHNSTCSSVKPDANATKEMWVNKMLCQRIRGGVFGVFQDRHELTARSLRADRPIGQDAIHTPQCRPSLLMTRRLRDCDQKLSEPRISKNQPEDVARIINAQQCGNIGGRFIATFFTKMNALVKSLRQQTASLSNITSSADTCLTLGIQAVARTRIIGFLDTVVSAIYITRWAAFSFKQGLAAVTETMLDIVELAARAAGRSNLAIEKSCVAGTARSRFFVILGYSVMEQYQCALYSGFSKIFLYGSHRHIQYRKVTDICLPFFPKTILSRE